MYVFKSDSKYLVCSGRYLCFSVKSPISIDRDSIGKHFNGMEVEIDGEKHVVCRVESFATLFVNKGDKIGLCVEWMNDLHKNSQNQYLTD